MWAALSVSALRRKVPDGLHLSVRNWKCGSFLHTPRCRVAVHKHYGSTKKTQSAVKFSAAGGKKRRLYQPWTVSGAVTQSVPVLFTIIHWSCILADSICQPRDRSTHCTSLLPGGVEGRRGRRGRAGEMKKKKRTGWDGAQGEGLNCWEFRLWKLEMWLWLETTRPKWKSLSIHASPRMEVMQALHRVKQTKRREDEISLF